MSQESKQSHLYVRWLFLRILSFCYFVAFASAAVQIDGLYGANGIEPVSEFLDQMQYRLGIDAYLNFPSIFWFNCSTGFMQTICWLGAAISAAAFCGWLSAASFLLAWIFYLSIVSVGQDFMSFQWDALLLETGLLAIFFAPNSIREINPFKQRKKFESQAEPSIIFLFLLRMLCFKLMFLSGVCKLSSLDLDGTNAWRDLSALSYHYLSQPLPTPAAWLFDKFPAIIQKLSTLMMFAVELVLPLSLLTFTRPARLIAAAGFVCLMFLIMLTGNYAFFNWLTIALSICLLDDKAILAMLPRYAKMKKSIMHRRSDFAIWKNTAISFIPALMIGSASLGILWILFDHYGSKRTVPQFFKIAAVFGQPLRSFNSYGLFANMTKGRPEIIIQGSNDGTHWLSYEFKYKPGDLHRAPPLVAPHQPRLDWQMWFAALGPARQSPWFDRLVQRLLQGSPEVLALLEKNPFPEKPPKQIRAVTYSYQFSSFESLTKTGKWWSRNPRGWFYPPCSLSDFIGP